VEHKFPGLIKDRTPAGNARWLVRVKGNPRKRITLPVGPDDPRFSELYHAARAGHKDPLKPRPSEQATPRSLDWLRHAYLEALERKVSNGHASPYTLKGHRSLLSRLCDMEDADGDRYGGNSLEAPQAAFVAARDAMASTPGSADNMMKATRAMYEWAIEAGHCRTNPARGIRKINRGGKAARPWSPDDLLKYRDRHPPGTMAHLALTILMFTSCRRGDAFRLGRQHEVTWEGMTWLKWQPAKKGSASVMIPMMPPLEGAVREITVIGPTYLMTEYGKPFASAAAFGNKFRQWCNEADLNHLSAHGIRKSTGELLALEGCSQYHIMAIHGHTQAKTSEVYTKGVSRARLAAEAMQKLGGMTW